MVSMAVQNKGKRGRERSQAIYTDKQANAQPSAKDRPARRPAALTDTQRPRPWFERGKPHRGELTQTAPRRANANRETIRLASLTPRQR